MVTEKISVTRCDAPGCAEAEGTARYVIQTPAGRFTLDLCQSHSLPIQELAEAVRPSRRRTETRRAATAAELAAQKRAAKKTSAR